MYRKDFDKWNEIKRTVQAKEKIPYFKEREIWFCRIGCNVGNEEDGKGNDFRRPVLIVKRCSKNLFIGIPLTTTVKDGPFYFQLNKLNKATSIAMLSQIRVFSSKRLIHRIETISDTMFFKIRSVAKRYIFGD